MARQPGVDAAEHLEGVMTRVIAPHLLAQHRLADAVGMSPIGDRSLLAGESLQRP
jgi:hypothetical protein